MEKSFEIMDLNEKIKGMQKELVDLSEVVFYLRMGFPLSMKIVRLPAACLYCMQS